MVLVLFIFDSFFKKHDLKVHCLQIVCLVCLCLTFNHSITDSIYCLQATEGLRRSLLVMNKQLMI